MVSTKRKMELYATLGPECKRWRKEGVDLINTMTNSPRECSSCLEECQPDRFPSVTLDASCGHKTFDTCWDCLQKYIDAKTESCNLTEIKCPETDCHTTFGYSQMQEYASKDLFSRYDHLVAQETLKEIPGYVKCAHCESGGIVDADLNSFMTCGSCSNKTCVGCRTHWHMGVSCAENMVKVTKIEKEEAAIARMGISIDPRTWRLVNETMTPCPGCRLWSKNYKGGRL